MNKRTVKVFELIKESYSLEFIQTKLSLNAKELSECLKEIRDYGYNFNKVYNSLGEINLKQDTRINTSANNKTRIVVKDNIIRCVFISDLHIGSIYAKNTFLDIVYNYLIKHNIHILINGGDLIDGIYEEYMDQIEIKDLVKQADKVLDIHPFDKSIANFILYGNHDYKGLLEDGFDIARYLEERRYDLISLGYGQCEILLRDDIIGVMHELKGKNVNLPPTQNASITFKGHAHKCKNSFKEDKVIYIPALTDKNNNAYEFRPLIGFLDTTFLFYNKRIERVNIKQLAIIDNEIRLANEEAIILQKVPHNIKKRK